MNLTPGTVVHYDWEHSVLHVVEQTADGLQVVAKPMNLGGDVKYVASGQNVPSGVLHYSPLSHLVVREELHPRTGRAYVRVRSDGEQVLALIVETAELDLSGLKEITPQP